MITFLVSVTTTLICAGAVVAGVCYFVNKQAERSRSDQIDREYARLCEDPRYRPNNW